MTTTTALVTGANKGLGQETVRRLAILGWKVFLTARDTSRGTKAAAELAATGLDVEFIALDVTSDDSVRAAADTVGERIRHLDVLVNNAGIGEGPIAPPDASAADLRKVFEVNVLGPVRVTHAFLPLLQAAEQPRIVMVSSGMGSFAVTEDPRFSGMVAPSLGYPAAKAALNMITMQYARALDGIRINAVDPGFTATDLTNHAGFQSVSEGTDAIVKLACIDAEGPTGGFFDRNGSVRW
ncbi:SDR family NAD(P)-dependent oxidoreductase [Nocardia sp. NBC_01730]|uniref:SDR family NAD(P)-dependent oxidoreductase n=1 Tax=Nocardia sp. NBC_01730 TaxID=2975998 RepID=UPI002E134C2E|nr:SDR family NAD(P)-dependent oxidoreductase [Nocardia sp. NBC_01730]